MSTLNRVMKELQKEADRCVDIVFRSTLLALHRNEHWGLKRVDKFAGELGQIFSSVADTDKSSVQMLQEETGIELQCGDGKHWWDLPFLNITMWHDGPVTPAKMVYLRQQQKKWIKTSFMASVLLAMHRLYGWGMERDLRLLDWMNDIENECDNSAKRLDDCLANELGIRLQHKGKNNVKLVLLDEV